MFYLVTGGSGSGKSAYAEELILRLRAGCGDGALYYIATMDPVGGETMRKIEAHRRMRAGKGFQTIECRTGLAECAREHCRKRSFALVECLSNLTANELYREDGAKEGTHDAILRGMEALLSVCRTVVAVTNDVSRELPGDSREMLRFQRVFGQINASMARMADCVTEVVYGIPVEVKG